MKNRIITILVLFSLAVQSGISQDKGTLKLVNSYINTAFWNLQGVNQPLMKWADSIDTIHYKIVGDFKYLNQKRWKKNISLIESLIDKKLTPTEGNDYQILIFFGEIKDYALLTRYNVPLNESSEFTSWSNRIWNNDYSLIRASNCIVPSKVKDSYNGNYYLKMVILESLGILGKIDDEHSNSIFNKHKTSSNPNLTREDRRLVKLHYNKAITSGMDEADVKQTLFGLYNIKQLAKEKL